MEGDEPQVDEGNQGDNGEGNYQGGDEGDQSGQLNYGDASGQLGSVRALFDFTGEGTDQLTFKEGAVITQVEEIGGGWSRGVYEGNEGLFPSDYAEKLGLDDGGLEGDDGEGGRDDKRERRRRAEEALESMERQIEEDALAKADLERELEQLRLVQQHTKSELESMSLSRSDTLTLLQDLMAVMFQLDEEIDGMATMESARLALQSELHEVAESINRDIKKGSPLEPFKADIGRKLSLFQISLTDDDKFTGIYEKRKGEFYFILKQLLDVLRNAQSV